MIETDDGTWVGPMAGWSADERITMPTWLVGEGAYAGLVAFMDMTGTAERGIEDLEVVALIYEGQVPAAVMAAATATLTSVAGRMALVEIEDPGEISSEDGDEQLRDRSVSGSIEMSDPRLSGSVEALVNLDVHAVTDSVGRTTLSWGLMSIENDDGSWGFEWSSGSGLDGVHALIAQGIGEEDYEGWSARLRMTPEGGMTGLYDVEGVVIEGELPVIPEPRSTEPLLTE